MTRIFIAILLITFTLIQNVALAYSRDNCSEQNRDQGMCEENPFCYFHEQICDFCPDNSVRDPDSNSSPKDTPCITCGDLLGDTNTPYSNFDDTQIEIKSNSTFPKDVLQTYCYKECPEKPSCILPSIVPSNASPKATKAYYGNECDYGDFNCDNNYHANKTTGCCDADIITKVTLTAEQHCMNNKGIKIWQGNDYLTFCTECVTDYHLEDTNTATTTDNTNITYGTCVTNTPLCSTVIINEPCETNGGTINGNAQWNTDNGKYDYSACTCVALTPDELGNCGTVYNTWNGTEWTGSEYTCRTCIAGACWNGDPNNKCATAQQGYYSPANDAKCHECPAGSTTKDQGADSLTDCILTPGTTKFCSNNGDCFTLPDGAKTSPASKTP